MQKPMFQHDCDECTFLGHFYDKESKRAFDGWAHFRQSKDLLYVELIRRWSNDEPDYGCMTYVFGEPDSVHPAYVDLACIALIKYIEQQIAVMR